MNFFQKNHNTEDLKGIFQNINPSLVVALTFIFTFVLIMLKTAWLGDDSMITMRSVLNFTHGYGLVFNLGERVQSYTHPLWMFLLSFIYLITNEIYLSTIFLSLFLTLLAYTLVLYQSKNNFFTLILVGSSLLTSRAFIEYGTSGLENPLSYFLFAILMWLVFNRRIDNFLKLTQVILISSLIFLCRMDYALILTPIVFFLGFRIGSLKVFINSILVGSIPAFLWLSFSFLYYGTPFPNTYYAKLSTGVPKYQYIVQGLSYFRDLLVSDLFSLILIIFGLVYSLKYSKDWVKKSIGFGLLLYLVYIVNIGGDFMAGRFFAVPVFISVFLLTEVSLKLSTKNILCIFLFICYGTINIGILSGEPTQLWRSYGIIDERGFYYGYSNSAASYGLMATDRKYPDVQTWSSSSFEKISDIKVACGGLGGASLQSKPQTHFVDTCALTDPLLSRLPASIQTSRAQESTNNFKTYILSGIHWLLGSGEYAPDFNWRIGHFERAIPEGYIETIRTGENNIQDPELASFYNEIQTIVSDPVFNRNRLRRLFSFNRLKTFEKFKSVNF